MEAPGQVRALGWTSRPVGVHVQRPRGIGISTSRQSPVGLQCDSGSIAAQAAPPQVPWTPGDRDRCALQPWNGVWFGLRKLRARVGSRVEMSLN